MDKFLRLRFVDDERGAGTVRGLLWFSLMVSICGMAVVTADGLRAKTNLQVTADAPALAATVDLSDDDMAGSSALFCAELNLSTMEFGAALRAGVVDFGTWDAKTRTFIVGETRANAESLRKIRSAANGNADLPASCGSSG